jgi:hypothetical protein
MRRSSNFNDVVVCLICKVEFQSCRFAFQNTFTNAEKLLAAAEELAQTGECSPNEIYAVARQLEQHVG